MKRSFFYIILTSLIPLGCHPGYKSLSKVNKGSEVQLKFSALDKDIQETYKLFYSSFDERSYTRKDTASIRAEWVSRKSIVSLDSNYHVQMISHYNPWAGDTFKLFKAHGLYFKVAGRKHFDNSEIVEIPIVYKAGFFYYPNGFFINSEERPLNRNSPYNRFYTKKKARKPR